MLLRFRVANHRSIREEQELSLVAVPKNGEAKAKASDLPETVRVAGIYGSNASGKSNVLDAIRWMQWALKSSHISWAPDGGVPRTKFLLDEESRDLPSFFEVDFIESGVRYTYGFEVSDHEVVGEWLFAYPKGRPQRYFERDGSNKEDYVFGRALSGELQQIRRLTRPNSLYLSAAASNNHKALSRLHHAMTRHLRWATQDSADESNRIKFTTRLLQNPETANQVISMVRIADLGISELRQEKRPVDDEFLNRLMGALHPDDVPEGFISDIREGLERKIVFSHTSEGKPRELLMEEESQGTRAWVSLIGPVIAVLSGGLVFLVDEIDSSLHPMISSTLIKMFKDPEVNPKGAQLIFASHDTTLLGNMLEGKLMGRDEVWFTEKNAKGETSLFSLAEFRPRGEENAERGYLQGRYGAVPYVNYQEIRALFKGIHGGTNGQESTPEN